jgi:hypothetical protein
MESQVIIAAVAGFVGILGLFAAVNVEEKALLSQAQHIDVEPTDAVAA